MRLNTANLTVAGIRLVGILLFVLLLSSCSWNSCRDVKHTLSCADEVMWTHPDSALAILESVDTLDFRTKSLRARYSLLYTMALDRNDIFSTDLSVITPAVRYYERRGTDDEKMKTFYYLGTVQHNAGDLQSAIASYIRAKEYSYTSNNLIFKGLISSTIADVYNQNNNYTESLSYAKDALTLFEQAGDSDRVWRTKGMLSILYGSLMDFPKSDSLYSDLLSSPCRDSSYFSRIVLNAAISCLWKPVPDADRFIELFKEAVNDYHGSPNPVDYSAYAYALECLGKSEDADNVISQLKSQGCPLETMDAWLYRIFRHRGEYKESLQMLEQSVKERDSIVFATVGQSVALAQSDYYENKTELLIQQRRIRNLRVWIYALSGVILVFILFIIYSNKKKKWERQMEEMSRINENAVQLLSEERLANYEYREKIDAINENYRETILGMKKKMSGLVDRDVAVRDLRSKYIKAYRTQLEKLTVLCAEYWESSGTNWNKDRIYEEVKDIAYELENCSDDELQAMIDEGLDGVISKLREDLPNLSNKDIRFISFQILGFDAKTISRVTGYSVASIYTKRTNLRKRIKELNTERKDFYLEILR